MNRTLLLSVVGLAVAVFSCETASAQFPYQSCGPRVQQYGGGYGGTSLQIGGVRRSGYGSIGLSVSNYSSGYRSGYSSGYGYGNAGTTRRYYSPRPVYHDTTHLDWHPTTLYRHGSHLHVQPGHYDVHRTGHFH